MTKLTTLLKQEHTKILSLLSRLAEETRVLEKTQDKSRLSTLHATADSLRVLVGEIHHHKEEHLLFPALFRSELMRQGGPRCTHFMNDWIEINAARSSGGAHTPPPPATASHTQTQMEASSLGIPLTEHRILHASLNEILNLSQIAEPSELDGTRLRRLVRIVFEYEHMLRRHIEKEDTCLFVLADQILSDEEQAALLAHANPNEAHADDKVDDTGQHRE